MSYEIIYNKQFLKTKEGKIIPIILMGSNNCTETSRGGRERRVRDWNICNMPYWCNHKIDYTEEELLNEVKQYIDSEELFKVNGNYINGKQWYTFVKNAIKQAKTIEELQVYERPSACLSVWDNLKNTHISEINIDTSGDLQKFIDIYNNMIQTKVENKKIYPVINFPVEKFIHQKTKKGNKPIERLTDFYIVVVDKGYDQYYVRQLTARHLKYAYSIDGAKQFKTEKEAQKWITDRRIDTRFSVNCLIKKAG
jgi:hypothetical protein